MYERDTAFHRLRVVDDERRRVLMFERRQQCSMYLDDPFETDFEYFGYFHLAMAIKPDAARTLAIGLGGGMVVKRMWRDYPEMLLDAVEIDEDVVEVAREFFGLPDDERIQVFVEDGRAFLEMSPDSYDIVIVDAYDDDYMPRRLITEEFQLLAREHMAPDGVLAYNFIGEVEGRHSRLFRSMHRTLSNVWKHVWVFPVGSLAADLLDLDHNIVILASDANVSTNELLKRIETRVGGLVTVRDFDRFGEDLHERPIHMRDVPLLLDEHRARKRRSRR